MSGWREIAEWDWVLLNRRGTLHAVGSISNEDTVDDDWLGVGKTACGRSGALAIPGLFTRMAAPRCRRCCKRTGMPEGTQSPKNDDACRPVCEARIQALGGHDD